MLRSLATSVPLKAMPPILQPTVAENVPWDPAELKGRTCSACACYFESVNPLNPKEFQGFCRRLPADLQELRVEEVRRDTKGEIIMRNGQPVMQPGKAIGYLYKLVGRQGTCFDGYRPKGTLPGQTPAERLLAVLTKSMAPYLSPEMRTALEAMNEESAAAPAAPTQLDG